MLTKKHHKKETQLLEEEAKKNPEESGGYKFTKNAFYSHSIHNDPSQKKNQQII